jgi:hypothetical protein
MIIKENGKEDVYIDIEDIDHIKVNETYADLLDICYLV